MVAIRQLKYFLAVADTNSFSKAAERLNVTQPPVSRQVAALEEELGVELFYRSANGPYLTAAGKIFAAGVRKTLKLLEETCQDAQRAASGKLGSLALGFIMHSAYTVLPSLTKGYMEMRPEVSLTLREGLPSDLYDALIQGALDAIMVFGPVEGASLKSKTIFLEPLCLAVPPGHVLASRQSVEAAELRGVPLIASPMDVVPSLRSAIESFCRSAGFEPTIILEVALQQTIISLVAEGVGLALVPWSMHRFLRMPAVRLIHLVDAPLVDHDLVWREDNENPALLAFVRFASGIRTFDDATVETALNTSLSM